MRLSVDSRDPGYNPELASRAKCYLDGVWQEHALTADEERGLVVRHQTNEHGELVIRRDAVAYEQVFGHVRIDIVSN